MTDYDRRPKALGLTVYDWALPQEWVDTIRANHPDLPYPMGNVVWSYDDSLLGQPVAITTDGARILNATGDGKVPPVIQTELLERDILRELADSAARVSTRIDRIRALADFRQAIGDASS